MKKTIKLYVLQQNVETIFSEAKSYGRSSFVPMSEFEINDLKISIAERLLHLNRNRINFHCIN